MHRKQQKCMHAAKTTMNLLKCSRGQATSLHDCCCKATGQWPCGQRGGRARTCRIPEVAQVGAPPLQLSHAVRQLTAHIRIQLPRAQAPPRTLLLQRLHAAAAGRALGLWPVLGLLLRLCLLCISLALWRGRDGARQRADGGRLGQDVRLGLPVQSGTRPFSTLVTTTIPPFHLFEEAMILPTTAVGYTRKGSCNSHAGR